MKEIWQRAELDRRRFLKSLAGVGGALMAAGCAGGSMGQAAASALSAPGRDRMGIQLYTVRDLTANDYEGTLARIAEIGYREVEPTGYGTYTPQQFRAILDRVGLTSPSTHAQLIPGPDLERQLAGYQTIGHRYAAARPSLPDAPPAAQGANLNVDTWHRRAEVYNQIGAAARPYGIKVLIHNHTAEFAPLENSSLRPYDVLLAETDPNLVAMQLDIGWATVAGQDVLQMIRSRPGRYPLWHVKDVSGVRALPASTSVADRQRAAKMAKVGEGEIDWKAIFAEARTSGLEHFYVEIEGEAVADGSLEASRAAYSTMRSLLG